MKRVYLKLPYEDFTSIKDRMRYIVFYSNLLTTRLWLAIAEITWAVALFWEGDTFSRQTYAAMSYIMAEECWGVLFIVSAMIQLGILLSAKFHTPFAVGYAAVNAFMWWFVTLAMYASVYPPPAGISSELAMSLAASLVFLRSGYNTLKGCTSVNDGNKFKGASEDGGD